nr:MAG TPA: hypothetical protein [Caudoviricetes sp.]
MTRDKLSIPVLSIGKLIIRLLIIDRTESGS